MRAILVCLVTWLSLGSGNDGETDRIISMNDIGPVGYHDPRWYSYIPYRGPSRDPCPGHCLNWYSGVTKNIELLSSNPNSWYRDQFTDRYWYRQWYLQDYRGPWDPLGVLNVMDHNVVPVYWMGYTGHSVYIAIVGDSIDQSHPALSANIETRLCHGSVESQQSLSQPSESITQDREVFDEETEEEYRQSVEVPNALSTDYKVPVQYENIRPTEVSKALPRLYQTVGATRPFRWGQGTRAAGVIAMTPGNGNCGVGIAYGAKVAGIDTSGHCVPDLELSKALTHEIKEFDIYVNLWGPVDDGSTMDQIGYLVDQALQTGIKEGRKGTGALYLVGAGDGKERRQDNCGADSLVNSVHTLTFASASQRGKVTPYSERCPAIMATAYSSGSPGEEALLTTDPNGECTDYFGGTAASTSVAAGIIALVLQSNPGMSYRDVMHLIALTSEVAPLADNPGTWGRNKAGFWVSNDFGFGLLNARNLLLSGWKWPGVGPSHRCTTNKIFDTPLRLDPGFKAVFEHPTSGCAGDPKDSVSFIEQVEVKPHIWYIYRGAVQISIRSPDGLETTILEPRPNDHSMDGFAPRWSFKTVQNWGEEPSGHWRITVSVRLNKNMLSRIFNHLYKLRSKPRECGLFANGCFYGFSLIFHGLADPPDSSFYSLPRKYSSFRLADGRTSEYPV